MLKMQARELVVKAIQRNQMLVVTTDSSIFTCGPVYDPSGPLRFACRRYNKISKMETDLGTDIYSDTAAISFISWIGICKAVEVANKALDR